MHLIPVGDGSPVSRHESRCSPVQSRGWVAKAKAKANQQRLTVRTSWRELRLLECFSDDMAKLLDESDQREEEKTCDGDDGDIASSEAGHCRISSMGGTSVGDLDGWADIDK